IAAAETQMEAGAIDVVVAVAGDHDDLVVDLSVTARVDVAADAVVPADADLRAPSGLRLGGLRACRCGDAETDGDDGCNRGAFHSGRCHRGLLTGGDCTA